MLAFVKVNVLPDDQNISNGFELINPQKTVIFYTNDPKETKLVINLIREGIISSKDKVNQFMSCKDFFFH